MRHLSLSTYLFFIFFISGCQNDKDNIENIATIKIERLQNINVFRRDKVIVIRYLFNKNDSDYVQLLLKKNKNRIVFKYGHKWINIDSISQINNQYCKFDENVIENIKYSIFVIEELNLSEIYALRENKGLKVTTLNNMIIYFSKDSVMINIFEKDNSLVRINNNLWMVKVSNVPNRG